MGIVIESLLITLILIVSTIGLILVALAVSVIREHRREKRAKTADKVSGDPAKNDNRLNSPGNFG